MAWWKVAGVIWYSIYLLIVALGGSEIPASTAFLGHCIVIAGFMAGGGIHETSKS